LQPAVIKEEDSEQEVLSFAPEYQVIHSQGCSVYQPDQYSSEP
jgi:hypothetical protein